MGLEDRISQDELDDLIDRAQQGVKPPPISETTEPCERITATFSMVHEACGFDPIRAHTVFTELIKTHDQPYQRRMLVLGDPISINCDWVQEPGYLIIENKKGGTAALIYVGIAISGLELLPLFQIAAGHIFVVRLAKGSLATLRIWANENCPAHITVMPA